MEVPYHCTTYSSIEQSWEKETVKCHVADFNALRREQLPQFGERQYPTDLDDVDAQLWPNDVFGGTHPKVEMAHLLPDTSALASVYFDLAQWVMAVDDSYQMDFYQKLIHGSAHVGTGGRRIPGTGIKHMPVNKIYLPGLTKYFDQNPCVLIVPVMTVDEMKNWDGKGYRAIVIAGAYEGAEGRIEAAEAYAMIGMRENMLLASQDEIETARDLLQKVVCGLAYSLHYRAAARETELSHKCREILKELRNNSSSIITEGVIIPKSFDCKENQLRVGVVTFADHEANGGHPSPDPLLLAVRAAVNWSWRNNQKLLASGDYPADDDEDEYDVARDSDNEELDRLAVAQFFAWRDSLQQRYHGD
jgi:hypothetical protein